MRVLEVTVMKNIDTGKEVILSRGKLDLDQFDWNCRAKFHQNCIAYEDMVRVEDQGREKEK